MLLIKETLKKLHERFPLMTLDELFAVLDCYVESSNLTIDSGWGSGGLTMPCFKPGLTPSTNDHINTLITKDVNLDCIKADISSGDIIERKVCN